MLDDSGRATEMIWLIITIVRWTSFHFPLFLREHLFYQQSFVKYLSYKLLLHLFTNACFELLFHFVGQYVNTNKKLAGIKRS